MLLSGLAIVLCTTLLGCAKPIVADPLTCRVLIDGVPALEVRLVLMRFDQGAPKPVLEGIADASGTIAMKLVEGAELPSDAALELTALVESVGSGDWQLNAPWSDPAKSPLKVKWPAGPERFDILLPKKAIRSI
jgi:hypothetical protein